MDDALDTATPVAYDVRMNNNRSPYFDPDFDAYDDDDLTREVWDIIDDNVPLLWDDTKLRTDRNLHMAIARVLEHNHPKWKVPLSIIADRISPWIKRPDEHSPYVDKVAVDRAIALDASILKSLTLKERRLVGLTLAEMEDPWGDRLGDFSDWPMADPRRIAWRNMTPAARSRFQALVAEHRDVNTEPGGEDA